jgi:predicted O-linked N-acetylglucosamine transferase (SPINDLY family)
MHTADNRLLVFARKPAPVQFTYLAYAGGTAVDAIDYRLTDHYLDPDLGDDKFYMEKTLRLSGTYWCYPPNVSAIPVNDLPALSSEKVTFGCLNNFCKVSRETLDIWSQVLVDIPNSRLLMYAPAGNHRESVIQHFVDRGVDSDRLEIVGRVTRGEYFQTYHRIDIALDPFPYAGGTTTCDALWMGVPVITLAGRTGVGRAGVSILSNAGLAEFIAQSPEDYLRLARELAGDLPRLAQLRANLRSQLQHSPLMDAPTFARSIEDAYRTMWKHWCANGEGLM